MIYKVKLKIISINTLIGYTNISQSLIIYYQKNIKLDINNTTFDIKREYGENKAYEDDGNTSCEGFEYNVLWAFLIGNIEKEKEWSIRQGFAEKYLYFIYKNEERLFDNKVRDNRFFSIYLAGIKTHVKRIDYNNNNYKLNSVLNKGNIVSIVLTIQDLQKKINLINKLENIELFKEDEYD